MSTQNAITAPHADAAAMSREEAVERNFGMPLGDEPETKAPGQGLPQTQVKDPDKAVVDELPEEYRGKSASEIAKSATDTKKKMHEATVEAARLKQEKADLEHRLTASEEARARYERLRSERVDPTPTSQGPGVKDKFRRVVNENEEVFDSVKEVADYSANEHISKTVDPKLSSFEEEMQAQREEVFGLKLGMMINSNPQVGELLPEIQEEARNQLGYMAANLKRAGVSDYHIQRTLKTMNTDMAFADSVYKKVVGGKGKDYWAKVIGNQQPSDPEVDTAKAELTGAGASPDAGSGDESRELTKLLNTPGGSVKARDLLLKQGILRPSRR